MTIRGDVELFLSDNRGIYIPRDFAECVVRTAVTGISNEDYEILEAGPEHDQYWDAWSDVCDNAVLTDPVSGVVSTLYQNGDLWLVPEGMEWSDEDDFFVWPKDEDADEE